MGPVVGSELAGRVALFAVAAAVLVWLAVSLGDVHSLDSATRVTQSKTVPSHARIQQALRDASHAGRLHPGDTAPMLVEANLLYEDGRPRAAAAVLEKVIRKEPQNRDAWHNLAIVAFGFDKRLSQMAGARFLQLDPQEGRG